MPSIYELPGGRRIVADAEFVSAHHPDAQLVEELEPAGPGVPQWVPRRSAMLAILERLNKTEDDLLALADAAQDPAARARMRIDIKDSQTFRRSNTTLIALAGALGLSEQDLDELFIRAGEIKE